MFIVQTADQTFLHTVVIGYKNATLFILVMIEKFSIITRINKVAEKVLFENLSCTKARLPVAFYLFTSKVNMTT